MFVWPKATYLHCTLYTREWKTWRHDIFVWSTVWVKSSNRLFNPSWNQFQAWMVLSSMGPVIVPMTLVRIRKAEEFLYCDLFFRLDVFFLSGLQCLWKSPFSHSQSLPPYFIFPLFCLHPPQCFLMFTLSVALYVFISRGLGAYCNLSRHCAV